jgi:hypothetical protein
MVGTLRFAHPTMPLTLKRSEMFSPSPLRGGVAVGVSKH